MIGRIIDMYFGLNGTIFSTSKKYKYDIIFTLILLLLVYFLNLWLIPIYGILGAAFSTGIAYIAYNLGRLLFIWKSYKMHPFSAKQLKVIALFAGVIFLFEIKPPIFEILLLEIASNGLLFILTFIVPLLLFKLEPELNDYMGKIWEKIKK
jgi:O-antigen/teichoic acid export membrane protein